MLMQRLITKNQEANIPLEVAIMTLDFNIQFYDRIQLSNHDQRIAERPSAR
jgi:hypothetical protein